MIALLVDDAIQESQRRLTREKIASAAAARAFPGRLVDFSDAVKERRTPLRDFLKRELYQHYRVNRMSDKARRIIEKLFRAYIDNVSMLPTDFRVRIRGAQDHYPVVCDYIASMTDRFALDEHEKLFNPYKKV